MAQPPLSPLPGFEPASADDPVGSPAVSGVIATVAALPEPESELPLFVPAIPKSIRRVKARVVRRSQGTPNPLLTDET